MTIKSLLYFFLAGLCEIGGGYLIWLCVKHGKPMYYSFWGAVILAFYGIIAALQPSTFSRTYAAYGGVFIVMSLLWGWIFDGTKPDTYDFIGGSVVLIGVFIILYAPRN